MVALKIFNVNIKSVNNLQVKMIFVKEDASFGVPSFLCAPLMWRRYPFIFDNNAYIKSDVLNSFNGTWGGDSGTFSIVWRGETDTR